MSSENPAKPNVTLDLTGSTCPGPILGAKRVVDTLEPGQVLMLISDCPGTESDLFSWAKVTHCAILKTEKLTQGATAYYIQKGKSRQPGANATLDIRGVACPGPIVEAKKLLNGMGVGETLRLLSNCPGISGDIVGWTRATGLELVATVETAPGDYEFYIKKRH
ncbi:MAG: sulfurtransferase TusA family protein [Betaproteobacteria bacterium]|nr:sulfurtransferase TusA family protein [Betaproteobacteria bacterium]